MGGGGKATQRTDQSSSGTTTTRLPGGQQTNVDLLMKGARDFYQGGGPQYFPGQTYAGPTANEQAGRTSALDFAGGAGQQFVDDYLAGESFWMNPENIFNPENIPGFRESQQYVTDQTTRNLTEEILPELRSGSVAQGALGGSRQEIGEGLASARTGEAISGALAGMEMGAYGQGLNMYNQAAGRAPQSFGLGLAPAEVQQNVGQLERADEQQAIDAMLEKWNFEELAPLLNLEAFKELIGTFGQYGGTVDQEQTGTSKTTKRQKQGTGADVAQGIGAILSLFASHSSLKKDIVPVDGILEKLQTLPIYRWTYKEETVPHIGPMAEEFQRIFQVGDGVTLHIFDLMGVLLGAVKELSRKGV